MGHYLAEQGVCDTVSPGDTKSFHFFVLLVLVVLRLACVLGSCFPYAVAVLRLVTLLLASGHKVGGDGGEELSSFLVSDFVKVHIVYLLFFCTLIIAHWG